MRKLSLFLILSFFQSPLYSKGYYHLQGGAVLCDQAALGIGAAFGLKFNHHYIYNDFFYSKYKQKIASGVYNDGKGYTVNMVNGGWIIEQYASYVCPTYAYRFDVNQSMSLRAMLGYSIGGITKSDTFRRENPKTPYTVFNIGGSIQKNFKDRCLGLAILFTPITMRRYERPYDNYEDYRTMFVSLRLTYGVK